MELVMPKQYVEIEEEEMMYLDGGVKEWYNKTGFIAGALNVAILAYSGGTSYFAGRAAVKLIKSQKGQITRLVQAQLIKHIGKASAGLVGTGINIGLTIGGTSIGSMIATGLDIADGRKNGYVFG
ncbi:argininosuccinate lyase [Marinilactibacillus kalidii]|uniref:argininosuccinate lyase n=1 Tax=Marinilactibacillus kalidii TaxID=2820274 RepID=UPI001ABE2D53|nr:argininosuccinate lyase [Marinilactibacillus kalidii]